MNIDLSTSYMGLKLATPFVIGASPVADNSDLILRLADAGASAIVMRSLFEEQLTREASAAAYLREYSSESFAEALSFFPEAYDYEMGPEEYLDRIARLKQKLPIPVIASLNGCTPGGWVKHAELMQQAGADALELNLYDVPTNPEESGEDIEKRLFDIILSVREKVTIPLGVKLSPFYTSVMNIVQRLSCCGVNGAVLFNRFYQPDLDIEELCVEPRLYLSTSSELLLRLRWMAILFGRFPLSLVLSGGVHKTTDAIKAVMAGADAMQIVSLILRNGPETFAGLVEGFKEWMKQHEYASVKQMRGALSLKNSPDPAEFERANYLRVLQLWKT